MRNSRVNHRQRMYALAQRGYCSMTVMTRARVMQTRFAMHPHAAYLGWVHPDDAPSVILGFRSLERLRQYVREMAPHTLVVGCLHPDAEIRLKTLLEREVGCVS